MNKKFPKWILFLVIPCVLLAAGYFALLQYYRVHIPYGTWVNGIYCTGLTMSEVIEQLEEKESIDVTIEVTDRDGKVHVLSLNPSMYHISYESRVKKAFQELSVKELFAEKELSVQPDIIVDTAQWEAFLAKTALFQDALLPDGPRMQIIEADEGFVLKDAYSDTLDTAKASDVLLEAIEAGECAVSLAEKGCYVTPEYSERDKAVLAEYEALQAFCSRICMPLTIQGETAFVVDGAVLKDWVLKNEDGSPVYDKGGTIALDAARLKEYAAFIAEETTTYWGRPWQFVNHNGDTVEVPAGNYGRKLYTKKLEEALKNAFESQASSPYELEFAFYPESAKEVAYGAGVGDSYIEVDIKEQHVYVYIDGVLALDSPCVTGDVKRNRLTPTGVFYLEYKQRNRTLRGENYVTPVSYWMHFYNHCGFHDAGWRKKFGEEIYLKDGSHGCVNMPPKKAKEMYELVYKEMPVLVY